MTYKGSYQDHTLQQQKSLPVEPPLLTVLYGELSIYCHGPVMLLDSQPESRLHKHLQWLLLISTSMALLCLLCDVGMDIFVPQPKREANVFSDLVQVERDALLKMMGIT